MSDQNSKFILKSDHHDICHEVWLHGFCWGAGVMTVLMIGGAAALYFT